MSEPPLRHPVSIYCNSNTDCLLLTIAVSALDGGCSSKSCNMCFLRIRICLQHTSLSRKVDVFVGTVSAVNEGYSINSSVMRSPIGGRLLNDALHHSLHSKSTTIRPWYTYRSPSASGASSASPLATSSHTAWSAAHLLADIKESSCRVSDTPFNEEDNANMPPNSFELPDGSVVSIGVERFKIPEILFNPVRGCPVCSLCANVQCNTSTVFTGMSSARFALKLQYSHRSQSGPQEPEPGLLAMLACQRWVQTAAIPPRFRSRFRSAPLSGPNR